LESRIRFTGLQGSRRCSVIIVVSTEESSHINIFFFFFLLFDLLNDGSWSCGGWSGGWSSGSAVIEHLSDVGVLKSLSEEFWPVSINGVLGRFDDCGKFFSGNLESFVMEKESSIRAAEFVVISF